MHGSRPPHPAARAFFEALDIKTKPKQTKIATTITTATNESGIDEDAAGNESSNRKNADDDDDKNSQPTTTHTTTNSSSAWIRKRIETLGWRNRYSQSDQYPLQMDVNDNSDEAFSFSVKQVQRGEVEGTYGTGATVWPASLVLLFYLQQQQQQKHQQRRRQQSQVKNQNADNNSRCHDNNNINNKTLTIVELGAGTGVVSIGAAMLFGNHRSILSNIRIVCTDGCEAVVELARDNIRQAAEQLSPSTSSSSQLSSTSISLPLSSTNATQETCSSSEIVATIHGCPIQVKHYWWGTKPLPTDDFTRSEIQKANSDSNNIHGPKETRTIVLVSDCVLPKLYPIAPLVEALDQLLSQDGDCNGDGDSDDNEFDGDVAYISYEHRYYPDYDPRDKFRELCQAKGLQVIPIPMEEQHSIYSVDDIELWKVQRAAALTK